MTKKKQPTKIGEKKSVSEKTDAKVNLNVLIDKDLRAWAKEDARRTGYSFPEYIERLIYERKEIAPPFEKVSLLARG